MVSSLDYTSLLVKLFFSTFVKYSTHCSLFVKSKTRKPRKARNFFPSFRSESKIRKRKSRKQISEFSIKFTCENIVCHMNILLNSITQFAKTHTSSFMHIEKILNRPINKFYNGDDVNVIAAELQLNKTTRTSLNKKHNLI